jgi:hypothetical protein
VTRAIFEGLLMFPPRLAGDTEFTAYGSCES